MYYTSTTLVLSGLFSISLFGQLIVTYKANVNVLLYRNAAFIVASNIMKGRSDRQQHDIRKVLYSIAQIRKEHKLSLIDSMARFQAVHSSEMMSLVTRP